MYPTTLVLSLLVAGLSGVRAAHDFDFASDLDLERYVSRPDLRPPKFDVTLFSPGEITPGYWFIAPYTDLISRIPTRLYQPDQVGPHIYDGYGNLVWSGGALFRGRNHFDFKLARTIDDKPGLSFILGNDEYGTEETGGVGVILDSSFNIQKKVHVKAGSHTINMHEFTTIHGGKRALYSAHQNRLYHDEDLNWSCWIVDLGVFEVEVETGNVIFEWWASEHINPLQSTVDKPQHLPGFSNNAWDWFHINSIDKNADGDYLISARHMNTIYKISGKDGKILWRLGGAYSTFATEDFDFSSQHDARFREENSTHTVISFLNNASDGKKISGTFSSAMLVALHTAGSPPTATLISRWDRPDLKLSNLRGNVQILPDSNVFVCWSANGYISEFTPEGRCVMTANFASLRLSSYRAYKFNFTSLPEEPPTVKAFLFSATPKLATTAFYVSWNGATEVAAWRFWGSDSLATGALGFHQLGSRRKIGFETVFVSSKTPAWIFAEALDARGRSLRNSSIEKTIDAPGYGLDDSCKGVDCDSPALKPLLTEPPAWTGSKIIKNISEYNPWTGYLTGLVLATCTVLLINSGIVHRVLRLSKSAIVPAKPNHRD